MIVYNSKPNKNINQRQFLTSVQAEAKDSSDCSERKDRQNKQKPPKHEPETCWNNSNKATALISLLIAII